MNYRVKVLLLFTVFSLSACQNKSEEIEYDISYDECKRMESDENHRNWNNTVVAEVCKGVIFEVETPGY